MSQTSRDRRHFPAPMRWLCAGNDPSRSIHGHQCGERPLRRSNPASKCPLYAHDLACLHLRDSCPACVASTIEVGAGIKSP